MTDRDSASVTTVSSNGIPDGPLLPSGPSGRSPSKPSTSRKKSSRRSGKKGLIPKSKEDSRMYRAACVAIALRAQGVPWDEIGAGLNLTPATLKLYLYVGRKKGWFLGEALENPEDRLEICLKDDAVQNLGKVLGEKDEYVYVVKETGERKVIEIDRPSDRALSVSMAVARGTGMLKQHQAIKTEGGPAVGVALKVVVEMPPNAQTPTVRAGSIGGQPAFDAEIVEVKE